MNTKFLQIVGLLALGYIVLRFGSSALLQSSRALSSFSYWMRVHAIPSLIGVALFLGVAYFVWNMVFGRSR